MRPKHKGVPRAYEVAPSSINLIRCPPHRSSDILQNLHTKNHQLKCLLDINTSMALSQQILEATVLKF